MAGELTKTAMAAVRGRMEHMGITQAEFAKALGVRQPSVSRWLSGQAVPDMDTFEKMAKALLIAPEKLLKGRTK